ncbi:hypothetical protein LSAT2_008625 [Lamellibrachia satsuma]|nr:hypothetical protein LSAT2_008625 [Lamellibrachia satsuma]
MGMKILIDMFFSFKKDSRTRGHEGGPSVSITSIYAKKKPRVLVQGLQAFPPKQGGNSVLTNRTVSAECHWDVVKYAVASKNGQLWAITMLDSDGQLQAGLLNGNFHWLGNYEQCMYVKASGANVTGLVAAKHDFDGRYCRAYYLADTSVFSLGMCVPSTCDKDDVRALISNKLSDLSVQAAYFRVLSV